MKVSSVLKSKGSHVHTVGPHETVQFVIEKFREKGIGALVVSDNHVAVQGIISERDIILDLAEHGGKVLTMTVAQVMKNGNVCAPDDDLELVMSRMTTRRVRHLAVSNRGFLCGIISIGDVVKKELTELEMETNVLRDTYRASTVAA